MNLLSYAIFNTSNITYNAPVELLDLPLIYLRQQIIIFGNVCT
jgi:hypothetical protein